MDYCDVFIVVWTLVLTGHPFTARIHWWASDVMLNFLQICSVEEANFTSWMALRVRNIFNEVLTQKWKIFLLALVITLDLAKTPLTSSGTLLAYILAHSLQVNYMHNEFKSWEEMILLVTWIPRKSNRIKLLLCVCVDKSLCIKAWANRS